jgi:hypothetical protein
MKVYTPVSTDNSLSQASIASRAGEGTALAGGGV